MLGQPAPAEHDATGSEYAFEKGVAVAGGASKGSKGDHGFADVWWRGKFGWEYKRRDKYKTLDEAYHQLCQYREALESPPLLIVSDIARIGIHTNFTGTVKKVHAIGLDQLADPASLDLLRRVFTDPQSFKPTITLAKIAEDLAEQFGTLAMSLHKRGHDPHDAAHFLMKCMYGQNESTATRDLDRKKFELLFELLKQSWRSTGSPASPRIETEPNNCPTSSARNRRRPCASASPPCMTLRGPTASKGAWSCPIQ